MYYISLTPVDVRVTGDRHPEPAISGMDPISSNQRIPTYWSAIRPNGTRAVDNKEMRPKAYGISR